MAGSQSEARCSGAHISARGNDVANGIAIGPDGSIWIVGNTTSTNLPTQSALYSSLSGTQDAFVAKFDPTGSDLLFSSYFGAGYTQFPGQPAPDCRRKLSWYVHGSTIGEHLWLTTSGTVRDQNHDITPTPASSPTNQHWNSPINLSTYLAGATSDRHFLPNEEKLYRSLRHCRWLCLTATRPGEFRSKNVTTVYAGHRISDRTSLPQD